MKSNSLYCLSVPFFLSVFFCGASDYYMQYGYKNDSLCEVSIAKHPCFFGVAEQYHVIPGAEFAWIFQRPAEDICWIDNRCKVPPIMDHIPMQCSGQASTEPHGFFKVGVTIIPLIAATTATMTTLLKHQKLSRATVKNAVLALGNSVLLVAPALLAVDMYKPTHYPELNRAIVVTASLLGWGIGCVGF